jgi:hypothetical protein
MLYRSRRLCGPDRAITLGGCSHRRARALRRGGPLRMRTIRWKPSGSAPRLPCSPCSPSSPSRRGCCPGSSRVRGRPPTLARHTPRDRTRQCPLARPRGDPTRHDDRGGAGGRAGLAIGDPPLRDTPNMVCDHLRGSRAGDRRPRTPTGAIGTNRASPRLNVGSPPRLSSLDRVLGPLAHHPRPVVAHAEPAEVLRQDRLGGTAGTVRVSNLCSIL